MYLLKGSGFGGMAINLPDFSGARAAVLPVPYDAATSYKSGTREGPRSILEASAQVELFDPEWGLDYEDLTIATLNEMEIDVAGPEAMLEKTERVYKEALEKAGFVLMLGGDHSLTTAAVRQVAPLHEGALSVVQFDAHTDLRDSWQGSKFSHASVMSRVKEMAPIVQVGVRNISRGEWEFIGESGHPVYPAWELDGRDDGWIDQMTSGLKENVYITFDLDCLDPSIMPGVGTPEPGGMGWRQACDAIKAIGQRRRIVGADLMELRPIPGTHQSEFLAARLGFRLLGAALLLEKKNQAGQAGR